MSDVQGEYDNYIEKFNDAQWAARQALLTVGSVADVLARFGSPLSTELTEACISLELAHKQMSEAVSEDLTHQVKSGYDMIGSVFKAALDASTTSSL